jgi:hypothetical protein
MMRRERRCKDKRRCKDCGGSQICEHGKDKRYCKDCKAARASLS